MRRREFVVGFAGALAGTVRLAAAQQRVPHIVVLRIGVAGSDSESLRGIAAGLKEYGYREGDNEHGVKPTQTAEPRA